MSRLKFIEADTVFSDQTLSKNLSDHMAVISIRHTLIAFYERLGYQRTGEFVAFPENPALWQSKIDGLNLQYMAKLI